MSTPRWITAAEVTQEESGDVQGPDSSVDGNIALFDGTTGKLLKAAGVVEGVATIDATTNVLTGDGAGNAIDSGSAIADLGSLLSANTARVDATGNDETGTIGNLTKPFLTVQAAIDAFVALASGMTGVIDIGANSFQEDVTINDQIILMFKGAGPDTGGGYISIPWLSLTLTAPATIYINNCILGGGSITTSNDLDLILENVDMNSDTIVSTAGGGKHITVISPSNTAYNSNGVTADDIDNINFIGIQSSDSGADIIVANNRASIRIKNCGIPSTNSDDATFFDVLCATAVDLIMVNSILRNIDVQTGTATFVNSKARGYVIADRFYDDQGPFSYDYDFARDGGASGTIALTASNGSKGTGLPTNFVVTAAKLEVITPLDSALSLAHVAMTTGETAADLKAATLVSAPPWASAGLTALTILSRMTGDRSPAIVITTEDLTAGKFNLHLDGYVSP